MIKEIKEIRFPNGTLSQAVCKMDDMGEWTITTTIDIDGNEIPDFSEDWEIEYNGARYVMPLRTPAARKENTSLDSQFDLTFIHWAQRELQRWMFFTLQPVESSTAVPDKYEASVSLTLGDFVTLFGQVLHYYYGDKIKIRLNPNWAYSEEPTLVEISYSYIWDVLVKLYELYGVRWDISPDGNSDSYIINVGYSTEELEHVLEYGFSGGLLKVERQVQETNIRNMLLGRGGEKNLPYRYFKDIDLKNPSFPGDPDWIPELRNIYFDRLRGKTFRDYIKGWKTNPRRLLKESNGESIYSEYHKAFLKVEAFDAEYAKTSFAYMLGHTDERFNPVEYVADKLVTAELKVVPESDSSIDRYGPMLGGLDNNDDIYPTIQGVTVNPYGRIDQSVYIEQITSDEYKEPESAIDASSLINASWKGVISAHSTREVEMSGGYLTIPEGKYGNIEIASANVYIQKNGAATSDMVIASGIRAVAVDSEGNEISASGIPAGRYTYKYRARLENTYSDALDVCIQLSECQLMVSEARESYPNTFDIWVKNLWQTSKLNYETDTQYAERVWRPILGDKTGEEAKVVFATGWLSTSEDYEFVIVRTPVYDTSKTLDGVQSHWRITLAKCEAEMETTGLLVPSTHKQGNAGDYFFFTGIDMPHLYVLWAEERLDAYKSDALIETRDIRPTWMVTPDRIRFNNLQSGEVETLLSRLRVGMALTLRSKQFISGSQQEELYLQSLTITYRKPTSEDVALNPDIEMTLGNDYGASSNPVSELQGEVSNLSKQVQGSLSNIEQAVKVIGGKSFLRKDKSDRTPYSLSVGRDLTVGDYIQGFKGARIDKDGNGEFESLTSRSYLKVYELIYNRLNALEGEYSFCDSATVDEVQGNADGTYTLRLRKRWESDFNAFQYGDIVYGFVNDLADSGVYAKAWGNVMSVDRGDNSITVRMYADTSVPGGHNANFTGGMLIARHGNSVTPNASAASAYPEFIHASSDGSRYVNDRQSAFFISAPDGCIKYLHGVNAPVVVRENLGMVLGRMPIGMFSDNPAIEQIAADGMPRVYAKGIITEEIIRTDYRGLTIKTQNFRGEWNADIANHPVRHYANNDELYDTVTRDGILYQCVTDHTTSAPDPDNPNCGWLPMTDHRELDIWSIETSTDSFGYNPNTGDMTPDEFCAWARVNSARGTTDVRDSADLYNDYGMELFVEGEGDSMRDENDNALLDENGDALQDESVAVRFECDVDTATMSYPAGISLALVDVTDGRVVARKTVSVVKDGTDGDDGKDGKDGKDGSRGPMAYPAGVYDSAVGYDADGDISPIVQYGSQYFILKEGKTWAAGQAKTPAQDAVSANPSWELVDKFSTVFTDILMANFAKLSNAVFYGDYMFSAEGTESGGAATTHYEYVNTYLNMLEGATEWGAYRFKPNFLLNLRTGQIWCDDITAGNTVFSGDDIASATGVYGSFEITKTFAGTYNGQKTDVRNSNTAAPDTITETELTKFTLKSKAKVKITSDGTARIVMHRYDPSLPLVSTAKLIYTLMRGTSVYKTWEVLAEDSNDISLNAKTIVKSFPSPMELELPSGEYTLKAKAELDIYLLRDVISGAIAKTGFAQVNLTKAEVSASDEYKSLYGKNGFLLGTSPQNYVMAISTPRDGMRFIAQNSNGYGLQVDETGIHVKDNVTGGVYKTLEEYVKLAIKTN